MVNSSSQLISDFVNTRHIHLGEVVEERLATPELLASWLEEAGLVDDVVRPTPADLCHAGELREAIRTLLLAHNEVELDVDPASAALDRAADRGRVELRFDECQARLVAVAPGVAGALGRIVIAVQASMAEGSWERLKACRASDCHWAFEDTSKNGSRAWCSMRSCGNREKARAFRRRHTH
jgi:predicted RNA-binding Zn ribbon-like protein